MDSSVIVDEGSNIKEEKVEIAPNTFEGINLSQKRENGEDFDTFKERRKINNKNLKMWMKGRLVWNSASIEFKQDEDGHSSPVKVIKQGTCYTGVPL